MPEKLKLREGEANLRERIFESGSLDEVIQEALQRGLIFERLTIDRVRKDGEWVSTDQSTVPAAVLYLRDGARYDHLITRRSEEERYALFKYDWTA